VHAALEGKPVPPWATTESVTSNVTASLNVTSNVTAFDRLVCNFCHKEWGEVDHMLIIAGREARGVIAVCNECSKDEEDATGEQPGEGVTDDVTQDDDSREQT
jgi:hypothetical protein